MKTDARVDAYIAKAQPFARPILEYLRETVHQALPEVEEDIKWSMPFFTYKGKNFCMMAAFKHHCAFHFWGAGDVMGAAPKKTVDGENGSQRAKVDREKGMGSFGKITSLKEVPSKRELTAYLKKAKELRDSGASTPMRKKKPPKPPAKTPTYMLSVLKKNKRALATWDAFSPSAKREYIEWITEAKSEETRDRRLEQAIAWVSEGKKRNWKYERAAR